ncbi:peptide N-acetyl-beta-D-glucosaminyl asparaginase amidase A-domain-containing protein [Lipomyces oligophaga]|uniref:peptide N-acetyl-beta-D-glucosaminyl asparaginase amidase A-domain-containing protein n=1 Tax=Lipomyces oligophaga TaxID=45792 RepID=UPI0034CE9BC0
MASQDGLGQHPYRLRIRPFILLSIALISLVSLPLPSSPLLPAYSPASPLEVFEVYVPPKVYGPPVHSQIVMDHVFGFSYGKPFVGVWTPPSVPFTHVHLTLSTTSQGRQFDRLALVFVGDHEVWRTSTAEPTQNGIHFEYTKDISQYLFLLRKEQPFIFEMGNLVDETYTGSFAMVLTATFYYVPEVLDSTRADIVVPLSAARSADGKPSHFSLPRDEVSLNVWLPRTVYKATALISASGNAAEEFWYTNAVSEYKSLIPGVELDSHGPHREIQFYVDDMLVGSTFAFPIIYTGGISPGFWRPIVGIGAFDVPMFELDLTPVLPLLWAGARISIALETGDMFEPIIANDWIVSGNIFGWSGTVDGEGKIMSYEIDPIEVDNTLSHSHDRQNMNITSIATRQVFGSRSVDPTYSWKIRSENLQIYTDSARTQRVIADTKITQSSSTFGDSSYDYPLNLQTKVEFVPQLKISAELNRGRTEEYEDAVHSLGSTIRTKQAGSAYYLAKDSEGNGPYGGGTTRQDYLASSPENQYWRSVAASNGKIVRDIELRTSASDVNSEQIVLHDEPGQDFQFAPCLEDYSSRVIMAANNNESVDAEHDMLLKECIQSLFGRHF